MNYLGSQLAYTVLYYPHILGTLGDLASTCGPVAPWSRGSVGRPFLQPPGDHGATASGADGPGRRAGLRGTLRCPRRRGATERFGHGPEPGRAGRQLGTLGQLGSQGDVAVGSRGYALEMFGTSYLSYLGMDQYLLIPFLGGWTSIYQLFWCSPGVQGFDTLPFMFFLNEVQSWMTVSTAKF